jgi:hypothetical protein
MHTAIRALFWEMVWKNRIVFPALGIFICLGAALSSPLREATSDTWWAGYARGAIVAAFLGSLLLGFAPFTLMDSQGGWRMNSMTTRWFILPVRTGFLVGIPLVVALSVMILSVALWTPILSGIFRGIDMVYILAVFAAGVAAAQALAWLIPRKPGQFWAFMALLFPALLFVAVIPQDSPQWNASRVRMTLVLATMVPGLALLALWAARKNRCGDWTGEMPLTGLVEFLRRPGALGGRGRTPVTALFWSDTVPVLRAFLLGWLGLVGLIFGWACLTILVRRPDLRFNWELISLGTLEALPFFAVFWLMGWGLLFAGEPGGGFQTRLSSFRAMRPVATGILAGMRLMPLVLAWGCVWVPLVMVQLMHPWDNTGLPPRMAAQVSRDASVLLAWRMAFSASAMVAALPWLMRGRIEGFPNVFLATLVAWIWPALLTGLANPENPAAGRNAILGGLLVLKLTATIGLLTHAYRQGLMGWRFPAVLLGGWLVILALLLWGLNVAPTNGLWGALAIAATLPLARLAACPWAMALNRHR